MAHAGWCYIFNMWLLCVVAGEVLFGVTSLCFFFRSVFFAASGYLGLVRLDGKRGMSKLTVCRSPSEAFALP